MAVFVIKVGKPDEGYSINAQGSHHEYGCDFDADVPNLPTDGTTDLERPSPGSTALVLESGDTYVLSSNRAWKPF